ncbi:methyltransferase domain-containing protein [Longispora sp. K20-0274]|uniref:methyltransferase domain-containing protein n=1 Tax=Longispora sp. K20-0274 TaxID=3088255 RepID=UPI00399A6D58
MTTPERPFAHVDESPEDVRRSMLAYLDAAAAHPEIQRVRADALEALAPATGQHLLDAGCGAGEVARLLRRLVGPAGAVTALDFSKEYVAAARSRHDGDPVDYVVGDVTALDFPDGHFDGVRSERVLQHLDDPDAAIRELARVTRPGGNVCVIDTDWASLLFDGVDQAVVDELVTTLAATHLWRNAKMGRSLRGRMVRAGLRDVDTLPVTLRFTDADSAGSVLPLVNRRFAGPLAAMLPERLVTAFHDTVDAAVARGEFLAAFTMWITVGRPAAG